MNRAWESKDQTLKKVRTLHFQDFSRDSPILAEILRPVHVTYVWPEIQTVAASTRRDLRIASPTSPSLDRFAAYILAKNVIFAQFYIKNAPKKCS